ncbi:MAG: Asp-tRNA(Asn)/Glu-tRNA(Gln) amidotransferase subunit GatB [Candidatus Omnitrophota bacterium]|jgi:aspartyl-tRNA(Asn)/glutamyl-tRNA(Gln) amidotransferase subunit B
MSDKYETVIGLEVHVQLSTKTKAFCGCSTTFGASPNSQVCPVCLGLPGALPVLNEKAFEYAIKVALALDCDMQKTVKFDRKNYYYPDLPKNYQISQFDMPLAYNGKVTIELEDGSRKDIRITRAHMEEDAGKLLHDPELPVSYVDLNRTGTPLLEIVSEPDIRAPMEAHAYLTALKRTIKYLGVSDCNMEEGSLRCDANISVREKGQKELGSKVEVKNMNSFKAVKEALAFEGERQIELLEDGEKIAQETRLWDEKRNITSSMRTKEETQDYRYFPEPDLVPFEVPAELVEETKKAMPELPREKGLRFSERYELNAGDVDMLIAEKDVSEFFENTVAEFNEPQAVCNWVKGEIMMHMNERGTDIDGLSITPGNLAKIIKMTREGKLSGLAAKEALAACIDTGKDPEEIVKEKGLEQVSERGELEELAEKAIQDNEKSVNDYKKGKTNALSFLVGQVMKATRGKANPKIVGEILKKKLEE